MASLRSVVLLVRDLARASRFYTQGLGLAEIARSPTSVALSSAIQEDQTTSVFVTLQQADDGNESILSTGYSPMLNFDVKDLDSVLPELIQHGAHLDGAVQHTPHGKAAALRSPDGHMIGLFESAGTFAANTVQQHDGVSFRHIV
eukprot:m.138795 g.138795  ORF g.138795 m.138795 type:complete len:145 (+) comp24047_c0_seq6:177-611(+)